MTPYYPQGKVNIFFHGAKFSHGLTFAYFSSNISSTILTHVYTSPGVNIYLLANFTALWFDVCYSCVCARSLQLCLTLCKTTDCSPPETINLTCLLLSQAVQCHSPSTLGNVFILAANFAMGVLAS